ncbi:MAG: hypothetical protein LQ349_004974 [Xanthoria aureola]|nr:MAG: hypothetical protein LQ349_004974 [Xanthoria aureola]
MAVNLSLHPSHSSLQTLRRPAVPLMRANERVQKVPSGKAEDWEQWVTAPIPASQAVDPNECFCTMSGNEVINPAMSKEDGTATSELLGENRCEGIDNDEKAPGNELASDSQSASKVVCGADEHAASSDQLDGPSTEKHAQVDTMPEPSHFRGKEDDSMSEGNEHFMSEEDDSMSEGTDISDEDLRKDLSWRRSKAPKPVKQFYDYIKLMEDRMTAIESQLQKAKLESTTATLKQGTEPSARILTNSGKEEPPLLSPPPPPR